MAKLIKNIWMWISVGDLETELLQAEQEGREIAELRPRFRRLMRLGDEALFEEKNQRKAAELLDRVQQAKLRRGYPYQEPSDLPSIRALRGRGPRSFRKRLPDKAIADRIAGAWLGRCAGCLLGKPVEGKRTPELWGFLKATRQWPLADYIRFGVRGKAAKEFPEMVNRRWFDTVDHMPVDDDTNYTLTGVLIVERCGAEFTPADVAQFWLGDIPLLWTCTAERIAYRNFALQVQPPASASYRNPYREWIGAQIRADGLAYTAVGNPQLAAEFAWRDACISHVGNGVYGEMLMAAIIAAAPYRDDAAGLLTIGLSEIPRTSRLHADVTAVIDWHEQGASYDEAIAQIHSRWDERRPHDWCHTDSNAMICAAALLYGEGDFGRSICRAVQAGFDTDCNGATVGSILGMMLGAAKIPRSWTARLHDTLRTTLRGHDRVKISAIAERTFRLHKAIR